MSDKATNDPCTNKSKIVRRKFTLSKQKADQLQELADDHYDGNRSMFLRSAAEDHAYTLERGGRTLLQEILDEIKDAHETIDELQETWDESDSGFEQPSAAEVTGAPSENSIENSMNNHDPIRGDMWPVYRTLADAHPDVLSVSEVVSSVNLATTDVRHALIDLQAREKIVSDSSETIHYEITIGESKEHQCQK